MLSSGAGTVWRFCKTLEFIEKIIQIGLSLGILKKQVPFDLVPEGEKIGIDVSNHIGARFMFANEKSESREIK